MSGEAPPASEPRRGQPRARESLGTSADLTAVAPPPTEGVLDELIHLLEDEARLAEGIRPAEWRVRAALLAWDGRGDRGKALELTDGVDHRLSAPIRWGVALESGDATLLDQTIAVVRRAEPGQAALLATALMFRPGGAAAAADLFALGGEATRLFRLLALELSGRWAELVTALSGGAGPVGDVGEPQGWAVAATLAQDRLGDRTRARRLLERAWARLMARAEGPLSAPELAAYIIERRLELDGGDATVLRAKLALLGGREGPERTATQFQLAEALAVEAARAAAGGTSKPGATDGEAADLLQHVTDARKPFGLLLAWRVRARVESGRGAHDAAASALEQVAQVTEAPAFRAAYLRRAAELAELDPIARARAEKLWEQLDVSDRAAAEALLRLRVERGALVEAAAGLEAHAAAPGGDVALNRELAQRLRDTAAELTARTVEPLSDAALEALDGPSLWSRARVCRRLREPLKLTALYRRLAGATEGAAGAPLLAVAGALAVEAGQRPLAESLFAEAEARDPSDLLVMAGRAALLRNGGHPNELAEALRKLLTVVRSREGTAHLHRQLARAAGDPAVAQESYERALEFDPDDVSSLHALARIYAEGGDWPRAIELREQAARSALGNRAAAILCEIGELYERRLNDDDKARDAYERALRSDALCLPALAALGQIHRRQKRPAQLVEVLTQQVGLVPTDARRIELLLEVAQVAESTEGLTVDVALNAYREVLRLDPVHSGALAGLERVCRREGRWEELVTTLAQLPRSPRSLRVLGAGLEQLQRWKELAEAREAELALLVDPKDIKERARVGRALADLHERRLSDLDAAARAWHVVDEAEPGDPAAARALERIYESRGRFADLAGAIERELEGTEAKAGEGGRPPIDPARRLDLWLRLAEIRRSRLGLADAAAAAYAQAIELEPRHEAALLALSELYGELGRPKELERVLDARARGTDEPTMRAAVLLQKGELLEREGDHERALRTFAEAFPLDPSNRNCFTAYERVCYRLENWRQAMDLYETALNAVEAGRSRAYRVADLYARRGQLQLTYLGQPGEAAASYLKVLELDPETDTAQSALERIFAAQSDWAGLIKAYRRRAELVEDDTKRVEILRRAARIAAAKLKDPVEAAKLYEELHSVDPTDTEGLDALERQYERTRDWNRLVSILNTRLSLTAGGDEAIQLYLRIAQMSEEGLRDADKAIEAYRKILDIAPSHREALEALGRLFEGTEKWAELVEITRRQIRTVTDRAQKAVLYFKCGSVMESKFGREDEAIRYYDAAIKTSPACLPAVHGLRDLYLRREEWPRVIASLELEAKLWTEDKERAGVYAHIGQIYGGRLKDQERAIQYYESALQVDRECLPANRALFELYFERGDYPRALPIAVLLTQKVTRDGDPVERSEFYRKRAVVAERTGDARAAAESLVVALEIRPENVGALDLLVELCRHTPEVYDFAGTFRELEKIYRRPNGVPETLARVLVGLGSLRELTYDIDIAEQLYLEALKMCPSEYIVVDALVAVQERLRRFDAGAAVLEAFIGRGGQGAAARTAARYRLAQLYDEGAMDPQLAVTALDELVAEDPEHTAGHYLLAQELYLLGRYVDAHKVCERLIQLAAAPGRTVPPEQLARYYDYLGRIAEAAGDAPGAARAYRRAVDLDPTLASACISLARRSLAAGDRAQAERIVSDALHAAQGRSMESELQLRGALARYYAGSSDVARAVLIYREILARAPERHDDRVAMAELLAESPQGLDRAREELLAVLRADVRHAPAYRLLVQVYQRSGDPDRAARVASMLALLGYGDAGERTGAFRAHVKRGELSEELRRRHLLPPALGGALGEALAVARERLEQIFPLPEVAGPVPVSQLPDPSLKVCIVDAQRLFGVEAQILLAPFVPGGVLIVDQPNAAVYLDAALMIDRPEGERRFLLGRVFEPLRGGYGILTRLNAAERGEVADLMAQLLKVEAERSPAAQEFVKGLSRKALRGLERLAGGLPGAASQDWLDGMILSADRAGLLACDDVGAAARTLARLQGEELAVSDDGAVAIGQVAGGDELVRFFLSDAYHDLRSTLGDPTGRIQ